MLYCTPTTPHWLYELWGRKNCLSCNNKRIKKQISLSHLILSITFNCWTCFRSSTRTAPGTLSSEDSWPNLPRSSLWPNAWSAESGLRQKSFRDQDVPSRTSSTPTKPVKLLSFSLKNCWAIINFFSTFCTFTQLQSIINHVVT